MVYGRPGPGGAQKTLERAKNSRIHEDAAREEDVERVEAPRRGRSLSGGSHQGAP